MGDASGSDDRSGPAVALRAAIESVPRGDQDGPVPQFSSDGGVTVGDAAGRGARVQPLGSRARISVVDPGCAVAEAEVDLAMLITNIGVGGAVFGRVATALERENGPSNRPGAGRVLPEPE